MIHALFLFPRSTDPKVLDAILANGFVSEGKPIPGLRSVQLSKDAIMSPGGPPPYSNVLEFSFDSLDDVMAHVQSPAVQAGKDELRRAGVLILMYEVNELELIE
jgi:hypothetical protein